jgi:hypothetical protein
MSREEQEDEENAFEDSVDSGKDEGRVITSFDPQGFPPAIVAHCLSSSKTLTKNMPEKRLCSLNLFFVRE